MRDIPNCINISADILVFGQGQEEHDQISRALDRKGITFNKDKGKFNKDRCLNYRIVISKEGASSDPAKVEAMKEAKPPRNTKELNSFLCTMQYNA